MPKYTGRENQFNAEARRTQSNAGKCRFFFAFFALFAVNKEGLFTAEKAKNAEKRTVRLWPLDGVPRETPLCAFVIRPSFR